MSKETPLTCTELGTSNGILSKKRLNKNRKDQDLRFKKFKVIKEFNQRCKNLKQRIKKIHKQHRPTTFNALKNRLKEQGLWGKLKYPVSRHISFDQAKGKAVSSGSGVIYDKNTIITSSHVINNGKNLSIITTNSGESVKIKTVFHSKTHDLAIVKTQTDIPNTTGTIEFAHAVSPHETLYNIGVENNRNSKLSDDRVDIGELSYLDKKDGTIGFNGFVYTGDSGGGVWLENKLVGIIFSQICNDTGIQSKGVSANEVKKLLSEVQRQEKRSRLFENNHP